MSKEITDKFIALLDDYLDGKLDSTTENEIKQALVDDVRLERVLKMHVHARANIRVAGEKELKEKLKGNFKPIVDNSKQKSIDNKIVFGLTALFCALLAIFIFIGPNNSKSNNGHNLEHTDNSENFQLAFVDDPSYSLLRSENDTLTTSTWANAVQSFLAKDYHTTLSNMQSLESDSSFMKIHQGKYYLMKGVANLKLENYKVAEQIFSTIPTDNPYFDQVEWFSALTQYYSGNASIAKTKLEQISNNESHYKKVLAKKYLELIKE